MRVHILQHMPFEGVGCMADWFAARGATLSHTRFWEPGAQLPALAGLDLVVAMGGPMSVNDEATLPWLVGEKAFLRQAVTAGIAVLGVCLGGQLIASALGARVRPNEAREIGWFPVHGHAGDAPEAFVFPSNITLLHWHGETFELPEGATLLASSQACERQAFQLGRHVIGLQCHPEVTPAIIADLLAECADELQPGRWVQTAEALAAAGPETYAPGNELMARILDYLTAR
jgi:GMP synthase-like glutamine amidotransferase